MWFGEIKLSGRVAAALVGLRARTFGVLVIVLGMLVVFGLVPAGASAESLCTDTWVGPSEGEWSVAADWSAGVPTSSSVACIGAGKTVVVGSGSFVTGVVQGEGSLVLKGTLEVSNGLESSTIHALTMGAGATLTGGATVNVSGSFDWAKESTMSGSGSTVLLSGASGSFELTANAYVAGRTFVNEGTLTIENGETGSLQLSEGAVVENKGTFNANREVGPVVGVGGGATPKFVNSGVVRKTAGSGRTEFAVGVENSGTIAGGTGSLAFKSGSVSLGSGTLEGTVALTGASVTAGSVTAGSATVVLSSGSLSMTTGASATIHNFTMGGGELEGAGTLKVSNSLVWEHESTMSGSGSTILLSGSSASFTLTGNATVSERTLVNEGTLTLDSGNLKETKGAVVKNTGTFSTDVSIEHVSGGTEPLFVNTGTFTKTGGSSTSLGVKVENLGAVSVQAGELSFGGGGSSTSVASWTASEKATITFASGSYTLTGSTLAGSIDTTASVSVESVESQKATLDIVSETFTVTKGTITLSGLVISNGTLAGAGTVRVSSSFVWEHESTMSGSGSTILLAGASGHFALSGTATVSERTLVNEGTLIDRTGHLRESAGALVKNTGTYEANVESAPALEVGEGKAPLFVNTGTFERTEGTTTSEIQVDFENLGLIREVTGKFKFLHPVSGRESRTTYGGQENPSTPGEPRASCGEPVSCATGNFVEEQTDFAVGGRGVGLNLTRTYNSQAGAEGTKGAFGYGWSSSFSDHLMVNKEAKTYTVVQADGATVPFTESEGKLLAPVWTQDTLSGSAEAGYTLTLADQIKYKFAGSSGRLESMTDRDGNATALSYNEAGQLTTITDPVGRKIKLTYNSEGFVEAAEDPMGHVVKYTYESGNLKSVTQPAETSLRWQFKYNSEHEITEIIDGRSGKTINEYNSSHQVTKQEDPAGHKLKFEYEAFHTTITNENTGSVTSEYFTSNDEPASITRGAGTSSETTETFTYNEDGYVTSETDGNGHTTKYGYDSANDRTSMVDPDNDETKWTYDSTHDVETITSPKGETTTIKRESHGNPEVIERPAPGGKTQVTKYKYTSHGELESVTNPLEHTWTYEYDAKGDRTAETDPETNKRTWEYNEDSQETATVSPRGNAKGAEPAKFKTTIERNTKGLPIKITDPLGHTTEYKYDGDGNIEKITDANKHTTIYTYNGDNEPIKVEEPNKALVETEYDGAGQVVAQIDGDKHKTKYTRNVLEEVTEVTDPLGHKTKEEYDAAGNLVKLTDPKERTTTYTYDPANRLTEVSYSSGKPAAIKYEYDKDGDRTKMTDGTGTTIYTYDQLDRLTESENGHKEVIKYEYDLANDQTKITYPNGKSVTRAFDKDGRLEKVTDWSEHATKFAYDADSDLEKTVFPTETKDEDKYAYNDADQMSEVKMLKSTETLASLVYTRDNDGHVKKTTATKLPGAEVTEATYDENNRVTKYGTTEYKYDSANNPTKEGSNTNTFNEDDELEKATGASYSYDELGERTKSTPEKGPATTYGYDQASDLTSVERPKEGETTKIEDSYAYNGEALRTSETISGTTSYLAWDMAEELPLILANGTYSFIYGPGDLPIEQINTEGKAAYLHHDQAGSTRLITGSTGTVEGKCTYAAYGAPTCEGTATTPLGYDGQYTNTDTGLIYLRAREYDPTTAQFITVDPFVEATRAPYGFGAQTPLTFGDPTGFFSLPLVGSISSDADAACGVTWEVPGLDALTCGAAAAGTVYLGVRVAADAIRLATENQSSTSPVAEGQEETKSNESEPCTVPRRSLPREGDPNSTAVLDRGNGSGQIRDYGPDGEPEKDFDFGHDHGFGDPHAHDWIEGVRQPGRPIEPGE